MNITNAAATQPAGNPALDKAPNQQRSKEEVLPPGSVFDLTKASVVSGRSFKEQEAFDYRVQLEHRNMPMVQANTTLATVESQIGKIQKSLSLDRPDLAQASWDFTLKEGSLKVTGNLSDSDKQFVESKLNDNAVLRTAVDSYMQSVTNYLETSDENPVYAMQNPHSGLVQIYDFHEVDKQLEGVVQFRDLISAASRSFERDDRTGKFDDPTGVRGLTSIEILAARLK